MTEIGIHAGGAAPRAPAGREGGRSGRDLRREAFDALADRWDAVHGPNSPRAYELRARIDLVRRIARGARLVVDIGCGTGHLLAGVANAVERGVGIDFAPGMVAAAERTAAAAGALNLRFIEGDAEAAARSGEPPGRVDLAIFCGVLEHLDDPVSMLIAWSRRVGSQGRILVIAPHAGSPWASLRQGDPEGTPPAAPMTPARIARLARAAGLETRRLQALPVMPRDEGAARPLSPLAVWASRALARGNRPWMAGGFGVLLGPASQAPTPLRALPVHDLQRIG
jgi:SAM-dependent methyltransferase